MENERDLQQRQLSCPLCGYPLDSSSRVCHECGAGLKLAFVPGRRVVRRSSCVLYFLFVLVLSVIWLLALKRFTYQWFLIAYNDIALESATYNEFWLKQFFEFVSGASSIRPEVSAYPGVPLTYPPRVTIAEYVQGSPSLLLGTAVNLLCLVFALVQPLLRRRHVVWWAAAASFSLVQVSIVIIYLLLYAPD